MKITGAIFDMDGTLVDSLSFWDVLWERLGLRYLSDPAFRPDPETEKAIRTLPLAEAMELLHRATGIGADGEELLRVADAMIAAFYAEEVELKPGARELLEHLYQKGIPMCVASATARKHLDAVIAKFGLSSYFSAIHSCGEGGRGKEHPDVFLAALEALGTEQASTWVFEDSVTALETAARAGFPTVGIWDRYGYAPERVRALSGVYVGPGDSLATLIATI